MVRAAPKASTMSAQGMYNFVRDTEGHKFAVCTASFMSDVNSHELVQFYPCLILFSAYSSPSSLSISSLASHLILLTTSLFPFYNGVPLIPRRHFSRVASQLPLAHPLLGTAQPSPLLPGSPPPRLITCGEPWRAPKRPSALSLRRSPFH